MIKFKCNFFTIRDGWHEWHLNSLWKRINMNKLALFVEKITLSKQKIFTFHSFNNLIWFFSTIWIFCQLSWQRSHFAQNWKLIQIAEFYKKYKYAKIFEDVSLKKTVFKWWNWPLFSKLDLWFLLKTVK